MEAARNFTISGLGKPLNGAVTKFTGGKLKIKDKISSKYEGYSNGYKKVLGEYRKALDESGFNDKQLNVFKKLGNVMTFFYKSLSGNAQFLEGLSNSNDQKIGFFRALGKNITKVWNQSEKEVLRPSKVGSKAKGPIKGNLIGDLSTQISLIPVVNKDQSIQVNRLKEEYEGQYKQDLTLHTAPEDLQAGDLYEGVGNSKKASFDPFANIDGRNDDVKYDQTVWQGLVKIFNEFTGRQGEKEFAEMLINVLRPSAASGSEALAELKEKHQIVAVPQYELTKNQQKLFDLVIEKDKKGGSGSSDMVYSKDMYKIIQYIITQNDEFANISLGDIEELSSSVKLKAFEKLGEINTKAQNLGLNGSKSRFIDPRVIPQMLNVNATTFVKL